MPEHPGAGTARSRDRWRSAGNRMHGSAGYCSARQNNDGIMPWCHGRDRCDCYWYGWGANRLANRTIGAVVRRVRNIVRAAG